MPSVEGDGALQHSDRRAQHGLADIVGVLPGQYCVLAGGGVLAHVERQAAEQVAELPAEYRQVHTVLETRSTVEKFLCLPPVLPHLWEEVDVRGALILPREAFDVLLQFLKGHGANPSDCALTASHYRRIGGSQQLPRHGAWTGAAVLETAVQDDGGDLLELEMASRILEAAARRTQAGADPAGVLRGIIAERLGRRAAERAVSSRDWPALLAFVTAPADEAGAA